MCIHVRSYMHAVLMWRKGQYYYITKYSRFESLMKKSIFNHVTYFSSWQTNYFFCLVLSTVHDQNMRDENSYVDFIMMFALDIQECFNLSYFCYVILIDITLID